MIPQPIGELEIVAELANGHGGDPALLVRLVELAAAAGADSVKAQMVFAREIFTADHELHDRFRSEECSEEQWQAAVSAAHGRGARFYVDVFGTESAEMAARIGVDGVKVHATDLANHALLSTLAALGIGTVLLGVGGALTGEVAAALDRLTDARVVLLHGFQAYPTQLEDNQIARLPVLAAQFPGRPLGFADHVPHDDPRGVWLPAVAVGAGATVLEKHLTLARVASLADHEAALSPDEFALFSANMRVAASALGRASSGRPDFGMADDEARYRERVRKALVAARDLEPGAALSAGDLALKRSGRPEAVALDPAEVLGRRVTVPVGADEPVHEGVLEDARG